MNSPDVTALVTGAASGMGAGIARLLGAEGHRVLLADVNLNGARAVADDIGPHAEACLLDVADPGHWSAAVDLARDRFGTAPNGLVHCAGVPGGATPIVATSDEDYESVIRVNQIGTFYGIRALAPAMRELGGGSIVVVSSVLGFAGMSGSAAYVSSKWAIRGLVRVAALELAGSGVRVNSICPGAVDTDMLRPRASNPAGLDHVALQVPLGSVAQPDDVAGVARFLLSDAAAYVTGVDLPVDGGVLARLPLNLRK